MSTTTAAGAKTFIVTGASRGLGLAIAQILLRSSHNVFLVARSDADMKRLKQENPGTVDYLAADLADFSTASSIIQATVKAFGKVDGIVVNHGVLAPITKISESSAEEWRRCYDINVFSAVALMKEAIPELRKTKGRVVFISSGTAFGTIAAWGSYGTSKAALNHFNAMLAAEEPDITSVAISPGKVDTDMQKQIREEGQSGMTAAVHASFVDEHETGRLLPAELPGSVIAKLVERAPKDLSGKHFRWNQEDLADFQQ
ncbi:short-chain dehydrogenase [Microdochium trichocladiopsis]|uniref:Short-chain dehydrogenase n=1 Tax=Microdochium trichocladiopsis TaxID=1682393 RepID=A0A9P8YG96_9PEZI|nr:short-chain dehydrogenase [Microdochium trichocladiopsis]KAH7037515.1 short-chain dehydrogenase [Microdochium trichocladiopsis]